MEFEKKDLINLNCQPIFGKNKQKRKGAAAYQLGNTSSRMITEVKQRPILSVGSVLIKN